MKHREPDVAGVRPCIAPWTLLLVELSSNIHNQSPGPRPSTLVTGEAGTSPAGGLQGLQSLEDREALVGSGVGP